MAYTNSKLVSKTKISPNKNVNRTHKIDTITIHCYVGQVTIDRALDGFANPSRQASCNYVIGYDGKIGLCVEEKDRSWCSGGKDKNGNPIKVNGISGSENDQRAVTIEVASDTKAPYAVTKEAYDSLIKLVADICKRNGIKQLLWKGDKSLVGKVDKQNMTVHRWFANKSCPGDYLYGKHGDIATKVNAILNPPKKEEPKKETPKVTVSYFPTYKGKSVSIVDGLKSVKATTTFAYRTKIAKANGIKLYVGTAKQNKTMLDLLKKGKLIKP